jgi:FlaG/FlaF family flagellin (archaellin)
MSMSSNMKDVAEIVGVVVLLAAALGLAALVLGL